MTLMPFGAPSKKSDWQLVFDKVKRGSLKHNQAYPLLFTCAIDMGCSMQASFIAQGKRSAA